MSPPDLELPFLGKSDIYITSQLFKSERLTLAREAARLTKVELASRVGRTASAISQFESGRLRPDGRTVGELALALEVPVSFFARELESRIMSVEECHFRSLRSASQKDRRYLLANGTLLCDVTKALENYVDFPAEEVTQLRSGAHDIEDIERLTVGVRQAWGLGLGPISNVVALLENKGVLVSFIPSDCQEVDAFSGWSRSAQSERPFVFLTALKDAVSRTRFDASHELGHLVMHVDASPGNPQLEDEANQFASAFLMPRDSFAREAPRWLNWNLIFELKRRWRVSARAIVRRSYDLELLSEASYRRAYIHLNNEYGRAEPHEPPPEEPVLIRDAVKIAEEEGVDLAALANMMGLHAGKLVELLGVSGVMEIE